MVVKHKFAILLPLMLGTFMAGIDSSIVNVSLPVMRREFNCGLDDIEWVITAYMLGFCVFMPLTNWLKQNFGFYRLYLASLTVFVIGSLLCGLSRSLEMLIISRAIQAFGGGAITPTAMAILTLVFPKKERGAIMGWWSLGAITGPALGPTLGGILTQYFGWPSIFWVNIPVGIATIIVAAISLRFLKKRKGKTVHFHLSGFVLFTLFILLIQYALAKAADLGALSPYVWGTFILSVIVLILFIRICRRNKDPLFDLNIFSSKTFVNCMLITMVRSIALYSGLFLVPFLLQGLLNYSETQSGLMILPNSIVMAIFTPMAGAWSDKHGPRREVLVGLAILTLSMFLFSRINEPVAWFILLTMAVRGCGLGLLVSPITSTAMSSVLPHQATQASSMYSLIQQLSGSAGIALSGIMHQYLFDYYTTAKKYTAPLAEQYAIQDAFLMSSVLILIAFIPALRLPGVKYTDKKTEVVEMV